jgi:membrane-associated protein
MVLASALTWLLHPDLKPLVHHGAPVFLLVVALVIFAECGLLLGFFLPGDSFLFAAGLVAGIERQPNFLLLLLVAYAGAVAGQETGYFIGQRMGPRLFTRPDSRLFKQQHVARSRAFFERHGAKAVIISRFVPIVRTFTPVLAGVGEMKHRVFLACNLAGGALWVGLATTLGWALGKRYPKIENYLTPAAIVIVALSLLPMLYELGKHRAEQRSEPSA